MSERLLSAGDCGGLSNRTSERGGSSASMARGGARYGSEFGSESPSGIGATWVGGGVRSPAVSCCAARSAATSWALSPDLISSVLPTIIALCDRFRHGGALAGVVALSRLAYRLVDSADLAGLMRPELEMDARQVLRRGIAAKLCFQVLSREPVTSEVFLHQLILDSLGRGGRIRVVKDVSVVFGKRSRNSEPRLTSSASARCARRWSTTWAKASAASWSVPYWMRAIGLY
jgi:hypothetical protein